MKLVETKCFPRLAFISSLVLVGLICLGCETSPSAKTVTGICVLPDGKPAIGIIVKIMDLGFPNIFPVVPGKITERSRQVTGKDGRFHFSLNRGEIWLLEVEDGRPFGWANGSVPEEFRGERALFIMIQVGPPVISYKWSRHERNEPTGQP